MPDEPKAAKSEPRGEARSAAVVAAGILLSKLVGLARQRVTAYFFGTSAVADVIAAAFRVGNLAQNLLGEGTLSASFIPVYAKLRAQGRDDEAVAFAHSALGLLTATVVVVSGLGMALAPWLSLLVGAGFGPEKLAMTARLVRIVFPMTGLLVLCAWALGVLNAHKRFFMPYAAPVVWSSCQIAALLIGGGWLALRGEPLAQVLALGALVGAAIELGALCLAARPLLGSLKLAFDHRAAAVRRAASRLPGVLVGRGVIQISGLLDTLLVSFLADGSTATFGYAQTLYLLPMSLLGTGEAAVALPAMARDSADDDVERRHAQMRQRLGGTLARIAALSIAPMVVLVLFGGELVGVLLRTGSFDDRSTARVAAALSVYGFALLPNATVRLYATTFFALGETKLPARYAIVRVVVSTVVALGLMRQLGVVGVVVGAMTAAWIELFMLGAQLRKRLGGLALGRVPWAKLAVVTVITGAAPYGLRVVLGEWGRSFVGSFVVLAVAGIAWAAATALTGVFDVRSMLRRR